MDNKAELLQVQDTVTEPTIMTVTGPVAATNLGITDAHTHVWIERVSRTASGLPRLDDQPGITTELIEFRQSGGNTLVDCQPGDCGRNGEIMRQLAEASGVNIVACTGFHLRRYYPPDTWLYQPQLELTMVKDHFVGEINDGLYETRRGRPVRAGFIKIACEANINDTPAVLIEAAALAGLETGVAIEVHTEKGSDADRIVARFEQHGFPLARLIICHIDKRPDIGFHQELAQAGVTLEYDTFYRPKYQPEQNVWPLLEKMIASGLAGRLVIATDMAEAAMWSRLGGQPGQTAFTGQILPRLETFGFDVDTIQQLMGRNIAALLTRPGHHILSS